MIAGSYEQADTAHLFMLAATLLAGGQRISNPLKVKDLLVCGEWQGGCFEVVEVRYQARVRGRYERICQKTASGLAAS